MRETKRVLVTEINSNRTRIFDSVENAAKICEVSPKTVYGCIEDGHATKTGYCFDYVDE